MLYGRWWLPMRNAQYALAILTAGCASGAPIEMPPVKALGEIACIQPRPMMPALVADAGGCHHTKLGCADTLVVTAHVNQHGQVTTRTFEGPPDPDFEACLRKPEPGLWFQPAMSCTGLPVAGEWHTPPLSILCDGVVSVPEVQ